MLTTESIPRPVTVLLPGTEEAGIWRGKSLVTDWSRYPSLKKNLSPKVSRKVSKNSQCEDILKGQRFLLIALVGCLQVLLVLSHYAF